MKKEIQHVFLVGAKSLGAYGGFETFVKKLIEHHQNVPEIKYHVACKANGEGAMDEANLPGVIVHSYHPDGTTAEFTYCSARCYRIPVPNIGAAQAIYYDLAALWKFCAYIEQNQIAHPIVYIMACRIGPFMPYFYRRIHNLGGKIYLNPDGHEWKRGKWNRLVREYWKLSEQMMVRYCDKVICDSKNIEKYIRERYADKSMGHSDPATTYIAYGADIHKRDDVQQDPELTAWFRTHGLTSGNYYLMVGRLVKENNYETIIREYMACDSKLPLVIISSHNEKYLQKLEDALQFRSDPRIRFVGPVYNEHLLVGIRSFAYGYIHGHEVGGTNPSLVEALGATKLNLLLDVGFNREVAEDTALYWDKREGSLAALLERCDALPDDAINDYAEAAKRRIHEHYSWEYITQQYEFLFLGKSK